MEVWTRGLEALAGGAEPADPRLYEGEQEQVAAAGGLGLAVAGVHLPPVELFNSQVRDLQQLFRNTFQVARVFAARGRVDRSQFVDFVI